MKTIPLTRGRVAIVDDEDYERFACFRWQAGKPRGWYASRDITVDGKKIRIFLHRAILDAPPDLQVDHRNGDGLDCRRDNLRLATAGQNRYNTPIYKTNKSGFKGVFLAPSGRWQSAIKFDGKKVYLGTFTSPQEAARAYDEKAKELYKEFAFLNFPEAQQ